MRAKRFRGKKEGRQRGKTSKSPFRHSLADALNPFKRAACPVWRLAHLRDPRVRQEMDERGVLPFKGGETAARVRVHHYLWQSNLVATYKDTRNGLVGGALFGHAF